MLDWGSTFEVTLPVAELIARGSTTFLALLVLMRIVGQREAGALGLTDVLLIVLVAEAAAPGLYGDGRSMGDSLVLIVSILFWSIAVDALSYFWPPLGRVLKAQPRLLIRDGTVNRHVMRRELMTQEELDSILRTEGVDDISLVETARIEPNGRVSILRRDGGEATAPEPPQPL